jgi:hypothetical protein
MLATRLGFRIAELDDMDSAKKPTVGEQWASCCRRGRDGPSEIADQIDLHHVSFEWEGANDVPSENAKKPAALSE